VGVDFIAGRAHALTDSLMLVTINLDTRAVAMVSVPRDTAAFPFYWGGQAPDTFKINGLVKAIAAGKFGSPDTPMVTLANEIGYLVGIKVDYYAAIDMAGFSDLVDLVGGVDIYNPTILNDLSSCTYVPKGNVHLTGTQALHYARSRESTNDYSRAGRQQRVMIALKNKMATPAILPKLGSLLDVAGKSIATNFPLKTSKDYVKVAEHISSISHCVLGPPYNYHPDSTLTGGSWTSRLKLDQVANLSVYLFGPESRYYGQPGVVAAPCQNRY
jgi:LCP family protein required for cell wall assembly